MKNPDLQPNRHYRVIKPSNDGTFRLGDRLKVNEDGTISVNQGWNAPPFVRGRSFCFGWIIASDVAEAIEGMEVEEVA